MTYKKHFIYLVSLIGALALIYITSVIITTYTGSGTSMYSWLDSKLALRTARIVMSAEGNEIELVKKSGQWFVLHNDTEYPARQLRVEDFINIFTARSSWPVRSSSASTHSRFGIDQGQARVTIFGENTTLLDILLGSDDILKNETYFRKAGQNEVRSGLGNIKTYITGPINSWYNLRLIPETENGSLDVAGVQKLSVYTPQGVQIFTRKNRGWEIAGINVEKPDFNAIENYARSVLTAEGDNFDDSITASDPMLDLISIMLELGNGRIVTIRFSEADESGRRYAHVAGKDYIYVIPTWIAGRLFRDASSFEMQ
ncbi:MAG: DUF4340 domain-containing protein [Treponema sp.]|nr:DUF4340 domain-containing protein [Treponema sp.]